MENRVKDHHFSHFREKGWVNIDLNLDNKFIDEVYDSLKQMKRNAINQKYKYEEFIMTTYFTLTLQP